MINSARVSLVKVRWNFRSSKSNIATGGHFEITFSKIWPTILCDLWIMGYFVLRNPFRDLNWFQPLNPIWRRVAILKNRIFNRLVFSDVWLMVCEVFWLNLILIFISQMVAILKIQFSKVRPTVMHILGFMGSFGLDNLYFVSVSQLDLGLIFKLTIIHIGNHTIVIWFPVPFWCLI